MNWQTFFGHSGTADWILLTAFHSLWLSLAAFLIIHVRRLRAPAPRSTWCTFILILLLILPLITWFIPRTVVRAQLDQKASVAMSTAIADSQAPLLSRLLDIKTPLPQARLNQWKVLMNQFGFLWLAVTLGGVGKLLYELAFLKGYCNGLQEVEDDRISAILQEINESFGFRKKPRFFISPRLTSPISMGMQTPLVILPAHLYQRIGDVEVRAILLHELAHIYHYDHLLGLLQRFIKAMYWWNPFVYRLCNALSVAREEVSDNYAISGMQSAASYATLLVSLIEKTSLISRMPCTAGMATPYESLETRIKNIVSKERDMHVKTNKRIISLVALTTVLLCSLVIVGSQLKVFGVEQEPSDIVAKPVIVNIKGADANFLNHLNGSVLVLEASGNHKYQSSPIVINGNSGKCEFSELIVPGKYKLVMSIFGLKAEVDILPTNDRAATLDMNISPNSISIKTPSSDRIVYEIGGPVKPPKPIYMPLPAYTQKAREAGIHGYIFLEGVISKDGRASDLLVLEGLGYGLDESAMNTIAKEWQWEPATLNGQPVDVRAKIQVPFGPVNSYPK